MYSARRTSGVGDPVDGSCLEGQPFAIDFDIPTAQGTAVTRPRCGGPEAVVYICHEVPQAHPPVCSLLFAVYIPDNGRLGVRNDEGQTRWRKPHPGRCTRGTEHLLVFGGRSATRTRYCGLCVLK